MSASPDPSPRVLIVEDDPIIALVMHESLADAGIDVVAHVSDRDAAYAVAESGMLDVALVDIALADGDTGFEIATELSDLGIDCIFVTARHNDLRDDRALGVLFKPFSPDELVDAVRYALALRRGGLAVDPPTYLRLFRAVERRPPA